MADTTGLFFIEPIGPTLSKVTRVQSVDLKLNLPRPVLELLAREELKGANHIQAKLRRNGRKVDAEVRELLVERMKRGEIELSDDQKRTIEGLEDLFGEEEDGKGWEPLGSTIEGERLETKYQQQKRGEESIALGRVSGVEDCSAEEAAAWMFEFCSRERMTASREKGDPARLEVRRDNGRTNEKVFVLVRKVGFPFYNREYLQRFIWKVNHDSSLTVAWESVEGDIDYGGSIGKLVRGTSKGFLRAKNIQAVGGVPQCQLFYRQHIDAAGYLPLYLVRRNLPYILRPVREISNAFKRDKEISRARMLSLKRLLEANTRASYTKEEDQEIIGGLKFQMKCRGFKKLKFIKSPDAMVEMKGAHLEGDLLATCMASTVVDASVEECVASEITSLDSRELKRLDKKHGITERTVKEINDHSLYYKTVRSLSIGLVAREFRSKVSWFKIDKGRMMILVRDLPEGFQEDQKKRGTTIMASVYSLWLLEPLDPVGDIPQTAAVFLAKVDLGGFIPKAITENIAPRFLVQVSHLRKQFDKTTEICIARREKIIERLKKVKATTTESFTSKFEEVEGKEKVEGAFPVSVAFLKITGKGKGWGKTTLKVWASLEDVAAFFWDFGSRLQIKTTGDIERSVEVGSGEWEQLTCRRQNADTVLKESLREFRGKMKLHRVNASTIIITSEPTKRVATRRSALTGKSVVLPAAEEVAIRLTRRSKHETLVELVTKLDFGKRTKEKAVRLGIKRHLDEAGEVQRIFTYLIKLQHMTKDAGETLGADLVWDGGELGGQHLRKNKKQHVENVCMESAALRLVAKKYPWFVTLMRRARLGDFAFNKSNHTKLECVEEKEAWVIGNNLMPCLKSTKTAKAGVDMWRLQNRAIDELFAEFPWMKEMFVAVGEGVVKAAPWGLMFRVATGAGTSMLDLLTDIYVTYTFAKDGKEGYFQASLACLTASVVMQICVVIVQNRRLGARVSLRECLPVLIGFKPALDAYRVASGIDHLSGTTVAQMVELTLIKGIEIFAESIPGVIIQLMAIGTTMEENKAVSSAVWVSLLVSSLSTGFIGATISYDFDTDPQRRENIPEFYGYVPSRPIKRSIVFGSMTLFTAGMLLIRCMTIVLLSLLGIRYTFAYIFTDLSLYLAVKVLRGDFWYWLPAGGFWAELMTSFTIRIAVKLITDFTSVTQFRHPNEVGGLYWSFSFVLTIASFPASLVACQKADISTNFATQISAFVFPVTIVAFTVFLFNIEKGYLNTFYSLERGSDLTARKWNNNITNDDRKADCVFKTSRRQWRHMEEEVRGWVEANWESWQRDKPKWFDEEMRAMIPLEYIPTSNERKYESVRRLRKVVTFGEEGEVKVASPGKLKASDVRVGEVSN